jgi:hypothetical protein
MPAVLNSTAWIPRTRYSRYMTQETIQISTVDEGLDSRWAAWQARGAANDRATRRKLFVLAAILLFTAVMVSGLW